MSEYLSWALSDGPPDVKEQTGKDKQSDPVEKRPRTDIDPRIHRRKDDPDGADDGSLFKVLHDTRRNKCRKIAEREQRYIDEGIESDPLAGAAERGGHMIDDA